jgi:hypothetical protein
LSESTQLVTFHATPEFHQKQLKGRVQWVLEQKISTASSRIQMPHARGYRITKVAGFDGNQYRSTPA